MKTIFTFSMLCIAVVFMSAIRFGSGSVLKGVKRSFELTDLNNASITVPMEVRRDDLFFNVLVLINTQMEDYFKKVNVDMMRGMGILMNFISEAYRRPPFHPRLNVAVSKIFVLNETWIGQKLDTTDDRINVLNAWLSKNEELVPTQPHSILYFTRDEFGAEGVAYYWSNPPKAVVLFYMSKTIYPMGLVSVHELGHILQLPDDIHEDACPRNPDGETVYFMQAAGDAHEFSPCDVRKFQSYIRHPRNRAQFEYFPSPKHFTVLNNPEQWLMANQLTGDEQCQMQFGPNARFQNKTDVCSLPTCIVDGKTKVGDHRHADFSSCGEDKVCYRSKCLDKASIVPVDGQWSAWSPVAECSKKCGGGIQAAFRTCTNPRPRFGGYHCQGSNTWYDKPCNTQACPNKDEK